MIKINICAVGGIKEKFFNEAIKEYEKRLSRFCSLKIYEVEEESNQKSIETKIQKESERLLAVAKGTIILLDREGKLVSSEDLAKTIDNIQLSASEITFIIGGSNGVSEELKSKANYKVSFGKITFPHQLFRVVLLEQIYRAFAINCKMPYHK